MRRILSHTVGFLLLFTVLEYALSQGIDLQSCTQVVSKPVEICLVHSEEIPKCCDVFCMYKTCTQTIYSMNCTVQYNLTTECCAGYNGSDCLPVCDVTQCETNEYCSSPNNCTCRPGWSGSQCNQVSTIYTNTYTNAVKVTWNIPDNTSNLNGYYVYIKDTQHSTTINDIVNNTLIDGLESFTTYVTCVVPLLLDGTGNELCTEFTTKQEVPATPPGNIMTQNTSDTAVVIQWTPPSQPNGVITQYTVYLTSSVNRTIHVDGQFTMVYITGLPAGNGIGVRVSAWNDAGEGAASTYMNYQLNTEITSGDKVVASDIDINAALSLPTQSNPQLSWLPPPLLEEISFYVLIFMEVSSDTEIGRWALRKDQSFIEVFNSLNSLTLYRVNVFVGSVSNRFDLLYSQEFFTQQQIPQLYPNGVISLRLHETSINISWSAVSVIDALGRIAKYTVRYSKGLDSCGYTYDTAWRAVSASDTSVLLSGLSLSSNYCVSVSVSNTVGDSPFSPYTLVPVTSQSYLSLNFSGISNCNLWKRNTTQLTELTNHLAAVLNNHCSQCITSDDYFIDPLITCNGSSRAQYSTTIIGTLTYPSSELVQALKDWSSSTEEVVVGGTYLYLGSDDGEGDNITPAPCRATGDGFDYKILIIAILAVLVFVLSVAVVMFAIRYWSSRHSVGPTCSENTEDVHMDRFNSKDNMLN